VIEALTRVEAHIEPTLRLDGLVVTARRLAPRLKRSISDLEISLAAAICRPSRGLGHSNATLRRYSHSALVSYLVDTVLKHNKLSCWPISLSPAETGPRVVALMDTESLRSSEKKRSQGTVTQPHQPERQTAQSTIVFPPCKLHGRLDDRRIDAEGKH